MISGYVVFGPNMLHSPLSFEIQAWSGRDKLGVHGMFQHFQYRQVHSFSAADTAHAGFTHHAPLSTHNSMTPTLDTFVKGCPLALFRALPLSHVRGFPALRVLRGFRTHRSRDPERFPHSHLSDVLARCRCPFASLNEIISHRFPKRAFHWSAQPQCISHPS
jgi:hypothetical protein